MELAAIWRYPVKSMAGERLGRADLTSDGVAGDRRVQVYSAQGRLLTARTHPGLLAHRAVIAPNGEPFVDGFHWRSPEVASRVSDAVGERVILRQVESHRFDVLPLLVATDGAVAAFGRDVRRLRPNLVIRGVNGLAERQWEGRALRMGEAVVAMENLRGRCVITTYDPDTQEQDRSVLLDIMQRFGGTLCLNASVAQPGRVAIGLPVKIL